MEISKQIAILPSSISNIIGKYFIEKSITNTFHNIYLQKINSELNDYCVSSSIKIINNTNKLFHISYDKDNLSSQQQEMTHNNIDYRFNFNNKIEYDNVNFNYTDNNWDIVDMPSSNIIDRDAFSSIKVLKEHNDDKLINKNEIETQQKKKKGITSPIQNDKNDKAVEDSLSGKVTERKKTAKMIFEQIPDYEDVRLNEDDEVKLLRESKLKTIQTNEQKQQEKFAKSKEANTAENMKKQKELENKFKTADAEGNLIVIKGVNIEKLNNDFISPIPSISNRPTSEKDIKEMSNPILLKHGMKTKDKSEGDQYLNSKSISSPRKKLRKETIQNQGPSKIDKNDVPPIIPAGSSYEMIVPEVGVTIIEAGKVKDGGNNYLKSFKKHSKYDYESMLRETIGVNSLKGTMEQIIIEKGNEDEKKEITLPIINSSMKNQIKHKESMNASLKSGIAKKTKVVENIQFNKTQGHSLKRAMDELNVGEYEDIENIASSLKETKNNNLFKSNNVKKDYEKEEKNNETKKIKDFNVNLSLMNQTMNNNLWGTGQNMKRESLFNKTEGGLLYKKPDLKQLESELGSGIVNKKIPKARLKSEIRHLDLDYKDKKHFIDTGERLDFKKI